MTKITKPTKVSIRTIDKIIKGAHAPFLSFNWNGIEVTTKRTLTLEEMLEFVNNVVSSCFSSDTNTYMPEIKDFVIKSNILRKYTNISLPANLKHQYEIIYNSDICTHIISRIEPTQYNEMLCSIEEKINHIAQGNIERLNKQAEEFNRVLEELNNNLGTQLGALLKEPSVQKILPLLDKLSENESIFNSIIAQSPQKTETFDLEEATTQVLRGA